MCGSFLRQVMVWTVAALSSPAGCVNLSLYLPEALCPHLPAAPVPFLKARVPGKQSSSSPTPSLLPSLHPPSFLLMTPALSEPTQDQEQTDPPRCSPCAQRALPQ